MGYGDVSGCQGLAVAKPDDEALFAHRTGEWGACPVFGWLVPGSPRPRSTATCCVRSWLCLGGWGPRLCFIACRLCAAV